MQRLGFIHDMMDVKVLVLFVMARVNYPVTAQQIYELCYQDDCLSYFDVCTAVPEMVHSGHLRELENQSYEITEKGRAQQIYELCYQDDCLSYFDVCTAVPEMVHSGHLRELENQSYEITEKGRADGSLTEDSVAFSVRQRAENAVNRFNRQIRRSSFVKTQILPRESGDFSVIMALDDEMGNLMTLELLAPDQRQAIRLSKLFEKKAESVYNLTMAELLDDEEDADES